jgi:hypothetical protein
VLAVPVRQAVVAAPAVWLRKRTSSTAATSNGATPNAMRRERRIRSIMGWVVLEVLIALVLAVGIVWWTMGFKSKKRPPADCGSPH